MAYISPVMTSSVLERYCGPTASLILASFQSCAVARRVTLFAILSLAAVIAYPVGIDVEAQARPRGTPIVSSADSSCVATETSRRTMLLADGRELVVDPSIFVAAGRNVLMAGTPNYQFRADTLVGRSAMFGVLIEPEGPARIVPFPPKLNRVKPLRAVALSSGKWGVLFAELSAPELGDTSRLAPILGFWYGVLEDTVWRSVESIRIPPSAEPRISGLSALVVSGGVTTFALPVEVPEALAHVALFERRGRRWSHEIVETRGAAYAALTSSPALGLAMLVIQSDSSRPGHGNSVFLYGRAPSWRLLGRIASAGIWAHQPQLTEQGGSTVLSWYAWVREAAGMRNEVRTLAGSFSKLGATTEEQPAILDSTNHGFTQVVTPDGGLMWVIDHFTSREHPEVRDLRIFRSIGGKPRLIGRFATPFRAGLAATAPGIDRLLISGGLFRGVTSHSAPVVTLLLQYRVACQASSPTRKL